MYQYYLLKCIIFICIFHSSYYRQHCCSCPHYCRYTANSIPVAFIPIPVGTTVITAVTAVLPLSHPHVIFNSGSYDIMALCLYEFC